MLGQIFNCDYRRKKKKLSDMLKLDGETPKIDFKQKLNTDKQDWLDELCKDVIAITNGNLGTTKETGYIIIGASDQKNNQKKRDLYNIERDPLTLDKNEKEFYDKLEAYCGKKYSKIKRELITIGDENSEPAIAKNILLYSIEPCENLLILQKKLRSYDKDSVLLRRASDGEKTYAADINEATQLKIEKMKFYDKNQWKNIRSISSFSLVLSFISLIIIFIILLYNFEFLPLQVNQKLDNKYYKIKEEILLSIKNNSKSVANTKSASNNSPINIISAKLTKIFSLNFDYSYLVLSGGANETFQVYKTEIIVNTNDDYLYSCNGLFNSNWYIKGDYNNQTLILDHDINSDDLIKSLKNFYYYHYSEKPSFLDSVSINLFHRDVINLDKVPNIPGMITIENKNKLIYLFLIKRNTNSSNKKLSLNNNPMKVQLDCPNKLYSPWYDVDISSVIDSTNENGIN